MHAFAASSNMAAVESAGHCKCIPPIRPTQNKF